MKTFFTRLSVALFTFVIGIISTSAFVSFTQLPEIKAASDNPATASKDYRNLSENKIQVEYDRTPVNNYQINNYRNIGVFTVFVNANESGYFADYNKNSYVRNQTNQDNNLEHDTEIFRSYEPNLQNLKPNKTVKFEISIPRKGKPFKAGFDFRKSKNGNW